MLMPGKTAGLLAALTLWGANLAMSNLNAMESGYLVAAIRGPAPQSVPIPDLPTRFLAEGQVLSPGDAFLLLQGVTVILVERSGGEFLVVAGPNRIAVVGGGLKAHDAAGLTRRAKAFFADPKSAVPVIAGLLRDENWLELALYYNLSDSGVSPAQLLSGAFFKRERPPEVSHPGGFARYIQPFPPSFTYLSHQALPDGKVRVTVHLSIDQGGGMVQEGQDAFTLRRSERGYQLLPKQAPDPEQESPTLPGAGPGPLTPDMTKE